MRPLSRSTENFYVFTETPPCWKLLFSKVAELESITAILLHHKVFIAWVLQSGVQPEIFQGKGGFVEFGHFDKHFVKNTRRVRREKFWNFFLLDTIKTTF